MRTVPSRNGVVESKLRNSLSNCTSLSQDVEAADTSAHSNAPQYYWTYKDGLVRLYIPDSKGHDWLMTMEVTTKNCYIAITDSGDGNCGKIWRNIVQSCSRGGM